MEVTVHARASQDHRPIQADLDYYPNSLGSPLTTLILTCRSVDPDGQWDTVRLFVDTPADLMVLGIRIVEQATRLNASLGEPAALPSIA